MLRRVLSCLNMRKDRARKRDLRTPVITSSITFSAAENSVFSTTATANKPVRWSKSNADAGVITLNTLTGLWSLPAKDFEIDNVINFTLTATDSVGKTASHNITVNITDVVEGGTGGITPPAVVDDTYVPPFLRFAGQKTRNDSPLELEILTHNSHQAGGSYWFKIYNNSSLTSFEWRTATPTLSQLDDPEPRILNYNFNNLTGTKYIECYWVIAEKISRPSNMIAWGPNDIAPLIAYASTATIRTSQATPRFYTNTANGTAYLVQNSVAPSPTQIVAGQDQNGVALPSNRVRSLNITNHGFHTFTAFTNLSHSTVYPFHIVHVPALGPASTVLSGSFTTTVPTTPLISQIEFTDVTGVLATTSFVTNYDLGTAFYVLTTSPVQPTRVQIKAGQNNAGTAAVRSASIPINGASRYSFSTTGLTPGTTYYAYIIHEHELGAEWTSNLLTGSFNTVNTAAQIPSGTRALYIANDTSKIFQNIAGTTPIADGQLVGTLMPKSGTYGALTAAADNTTRPIWVANGGSSYIEFNSANLTQLQNLAGAMGLYNSPTGFTFMIAMRMINPPPPSSNLMAFAEGHITNTTPTFGPVSTESVNTRVQTFIRGESGGAVYAVDNRMGSNVLDGEDVVLVMHGSKATGSITCYQDSIESFVTKTHTPITTITLNKFHLGCHRPGSGHLSYRLYAYAAWQRELSLEEISAALTYGGEQQGRIL